MFRTLLKASLPIALGLGLFILAAQPIRAEYLEDQVITWADFSRIVGLTASMNHVYAATTSGIIVYDIVEKRFDDPLTGQRGLQGKEFLGLWVDTFDEKLMVQTEIGRFEYDRFFKSWTMVIEFEQFETDTRSVRTPSIMFTPQGYNFLAGETLGDLYGHDFPVTRVIDDGRGTLWLSLWGYGLGTADKVSNQIELLPYGLLQNSVTTIHTDDSLIWVGGEVGLSYRTGLTSFDLLNNEFAYVESGLDYKFPTADVYCIEGNAEALYIGCSEGLFVYDRELEKITDHLERKTGLPEDEVTTLEFVGDSLFVGTTGGICYLNFANDSIGYVYTSEFLNQLIYDFELVDSTLWIAAQHGAYRLSLTSGKLDRFQDPEMVVFSSAYAVKRQGEMLWLAGQDGLVKLNLKTGKTRGYVGTDLRYNFRDHPFRALAVSEATVAVASNDGFVLFFAQPTKPLYREFGLADGLPSDNVLALEFDGDYLWIGTDSGLTSFWWNNPDRID